MQRLERIFLAAFVDAFHVALTPPAKVSDRRRDERCRAGDELGGIRRVLEKLLYGTHEARKLAMALRVGHAAARRASSATSVSTFESPTTLFECLLEYRKHELVLQTRRSTLELDQGLETENEHRTTGDLDLP